MCFTIVMESVAGVLISIAGSSHMQYWTGCTWNKRVKNSGHPKGQTEPSKPLRWIKPCGGHLPTMIAQ